MAESEDTWAPHIQTILFATPPACYLGALGYTADGQFWSAAASEEGVDAWSILYKEPYSYEISKDDGSTETITVVESDNIAKALAGDTNLPGLFIGGERYFIALRDTEDVKNQTCKVVVGAGKSKGVILVATEGGTFVAALYDEAKDQNKANARMRAFNLVESVIDAGL